MATALNICDNGIPFLTGEPPYGHAHRQVLALDVARAHMLWIGTPEDRFTFTTDALCGAVAPPAGLDRAGVKACLLVKAW